LGERRCDQGDQHNRDRRGPHRRESNGSGGNDGVSPPKFEGPTFTEITGTQGPTR
jgi:hypothetical protein